MVWPRIFLLQCLCQTRQLNGHVLMCSDYRCCIFFKWFRYLIVELFMQCTIFNVHVIGIIHPRFCFVWCLTMLLQTNISKVGGNSRHVVLNWKNTPLFTYQCKVKDVRDYYKIYLFSLPTYRYNIFIVYKHYSHGIFLRYTHYIHDIILHCKRDRHDIILNYKHYMNGILLA
jgi:hypothetical protein